MRSGTSSGGSDLFGVQPKRRRRAYEAILEKRDEQTRSARASRVRWLKKNLPRGGMGMPADTWFVFNQARSTFIDGHFIATVVLTAAFAEHWIAGELAARSFHKDAAGGLSSCVKCARKAGIWPDYLLERVDQVRMVRNPFVHLKELGHEHSLASRSFGKRRDPDEVAEADAKHALETILALIQTRPR